MQYIHRIDSLKPILDGADHVDVKTAVGRAPLRKFIVSMFTLPGWTRFLFQIRGILARLLGLRHSTPDEWIVRPENVAFQPGEKSLFFHVVAAQEEK